MGTDYGQVTLQHSMFLDNHHNAITVDLSTIFLVWKLRSTLSNIDR